MTDKDKDVAKDMVVALINNNRLFDANDVSQAYANIIKVVQNSRSLPANIAGTTNTSHDPFKEL